MKIAITGATGFIGQHLIHFLNDSKHEIVAVGRDDYKLSKLEKKYNIRCINYDLKQPIEDAFKSLDFPDVVIHLAWGDLGNYKSLKHLSKHLPNHIKFLEHLVHSGLKKLVVAGTGFEYGMKSGPLSENDCTNPVTPYGAAKDTLRRYLSLLQNTESFSLVWIRYFYMYGAGQSKKSFMSQLEHAIKTQKPVFNMSWGEQLRDYLPVEDVAFLTAFLSCDKTSNGIYNICSGKPVSIRQLAEQKITELDSQISLNLGYYPYPDYEPMAFWGERTRLDTLLRNRKKDAEE